MVQPTPEINVAFDLPWPWGGERFELHDIRPLNYIIGPLFSGKTRLAQTLAEALPDASFLGLDRLNEEGAAARGQLDGDLAYKARVNQTMCWLIEDGAKESPALFALIGALESENTAIFLPAPPWPRCPAALPADALQRHSRLGRCWSRRGNHSMPRQPQQPDPGRPLSRGARL
jgi:hypothetical protein